MVHDERFVGRAPHVQLDAVGTERDRPSERGDGVLTLQPGSTAVGDDVHEAAADAPGAVDAPWRATPPLTT